MKTKADTSKVLFEHGMSQYEKKTIFNIQYSTRVILGPSTASRTEQYFMRGQVIGRGQHK